LSSGVVGEAVAAYGVDRNEPARTRHCHRRRVRRTAAEVVPVGFLVEAAGSRPSPTRAMVRGKPAIAIAEKPVGVVSELRISPDARHPYEQFRGQQVDR
jgi:hypothetical protein